MPCAGKLYDFWQTRSILCSPACAVQSDSTPKFLCVSPHTQPLATTDLFPIFTVLPFPDRHINGILPYAGFLVWLLSLSRMHLSFVEMLQELAVFSFFFVDGVPSSRSTAVCLFTCWRTSWLSPVWGDSESRWLNVMRLFCEHAFWQRHSICEREFATRVGNHRGMWL